MGLMELGTACCGSRELHSCWDPRPGNPYVLVFLFLEQTLELQDGASVNHGQIAAARIRRVDNRSSRSADCSGDRFGGPHYKVVVGGDAY